MVEPVANVCHHGKTGETCSDMAYLIHDSWVHNPIVTAANIVISTTLVNASLCISPDQLPMLATWFGK